MSEDRSRWILVFFIVAFIATLMWSEKQAEASTPASAVGTSHSVYSALGLDARAASLGWAVSSLDLGAAAMEVNPASLIAARSFYAGHLGWVLDSNLSRAAVTTPLGEEGAFGASFLYFDQGGIDEVLADGTPTGERLAAEDYEAAFAYARPLGSYLRGGLRLGYFAKHLARESARGFTASLGLVTAEMRGLRLGLSVQDMGLPVTFISESDPAPWRLRLGASHHLRAAGDFQVINLLEYCVPRDNHASFGVGSEWTWLDLVSLRVGYRRSLLDDGRPESDRFHYGLGVNVQGYRCDYAFSSETDFGAIHRISLSFDMGGGKSRAAVRPAVAAPAPIEAVEIAKPAALPRPDSLISPLPEVTILHGLTFSLNSHSLRPECWTLLEEIHARLLATDGIEGIEIQGHTDSSGSADHNQALSLERARAVRNFLHRLGYPDERMGILGFGETRPLRSNEKSEGRAANRRVEIHLVRRHASRW